jgi:LytR cell envelope-related transcriptional attenuator
MDPVLALSISGPLTDVGAVAGLVAILGIAVLSLLYFAQAREVKRLREWAGRAPERAQELQERVAEQTGRTGTIPPQPARRVVPQPAGRPAGAAPATAAAAPSAMAAGVAAKPGAAQPGAKPGAPQQPGTKPGAQPAPAGAPAANANPATPGAATTAKPAAAPGGQPATPPAATPGGGSPKPAAPAVPAAGTAAAANAGKANANASAASAPPRPPADAERPPASPTATPPPARRPQPLRSTRPSASPRAAGAPPRRRRTVRERLGRRGAALVSALVLLLVVGGLLIATQGGGGTKPKPQAQNTLGPASQATKTRTKPKSAQPTVQRGNTTVAVLNGTTTPGLAATVSDQLSRGGFKRGNVTNAADQQQSATAILYAPGFKTAADEIASLLKLKSVKPIDPGTQAIAGSEAQVVVTVGTDRTQ